MQDGGRSSICYISATRLGNSASACAWIPRAGKAQMSGMAAQGRWGEKIVFRCAYDDTASRSDAMNLYNAYANPLYTTICNNTLSAAHP